MVIALGVVDLISAILAWVCLGVDVESLPIWAISALVALPGALKTSIRMDRQSSGLACGHSSGPGSCPSAHCPPPISGSQFEALGPVRRVLTL